MSIRKILEFPHPALREEAKPVSSVNDEIVQLIADMFDTMYDDNGIGLAANQIGVLHRIITIDVSPDRSQPICLVNPHIINTAGSCVMQEGCLSFPDLFFPVERPAAVTVRAQDSTGSTVLIEADNLLARCILHEIDHINGRVFTDYLSPLKLQRLLKKKRET